jgi:hypothetical protein
MPVALLILLAAAGGLYMVAPKRTTLRKGQARICFDSSTSAHLSELRVVFSNVVDEGNGCYAVTVPETAQFNLPNGARVGAAPAPRAYEASLRGRTQVGRAAAKIIRLKNSGRIGSNDFHRARAKVLNAARVNALVGAAATKPPDLYAVFIDNKHVGFAYGLGPARAMAYSYKGLTFKKSVQKWPARWDPKFIPIFGDHFRNTTWGRFLFPYNLALKDEMAAENYTAITDYPANTSPFQLSPQYLASR